MRRRRLLLATTALSTVIGCHKDEATALPENPKGSFYDAGVTPNEPAPPPPPTSPVLVPPPPSAIPPRKILPPANPKGSHYDDGLAPKKAKD